MMRASGRSPTRRGSHLRSPCASPCAEQLAMRHPAGTCGLGVELGVDCLFKPSTVSRWFSAVAGFYRACVFDGLLEHSVTGHVRRPSVPAESPVLCFTHLQFEALLTAARDSSSRYDSALVAMLGLLGLRIFEATGADLGEEYGRHYLEVLEG